ncbi:MAG: cytosolic protein [Desulfobacteraceae bacterium]|nr:cytosolic protein [Desulfobacteraceae bacterium]
MECNLEKNKKNCNCSYEPCPRKGICCECLQYHLKKRQLPGCCFSNDAERTYDRSFTHFARLVNEKKI